MSVQPAGLKGGGGDIPAVPRQFAISLFNLTPNQLSPVWGEARRKHGKGRPFQNKSLKGGWMNHPTFNMTDFFFFLLVEPTSNVRLKCVKSDTGCVSLPPGELHSAVWFN